MTDIFKVKIGFSLSTWIVFSNLSKTILLVNKFAVQAIGCKVQGKNNGSVGKNNNLGSRKLSLRVMQNMYSPNRFYITFPHDNSWNFVKILNLIKKLIFKFLYEDMIFPLFGWLKLTPFFKIMWNLFILTITKCTITIMIMIMIEVKSFLERHFSGISKIMSIKISFMHYM